ncbi:biotin--[acetyl-CoA-carboxylase] ligase [Legionella israelensis]|uniref:Bifunctional ligase/repressor BirA n=1 Tax=Legionella israelensis TaxID=454 RepID=A0AAX1EHJ3_9GAMM|nr:biotin--[acetyl-CoA-carboxylase] ligase [Legionella israelensis]QBR84502.1 biotin--[acetyl-CoA-carboxylase] ligase [Legionella israelensis]
MKRFTEIQQSILHHLQDGRCHSGAELGEAMNVSRTAIWKQIRQLISYGLPITTLSKQGYQLTRPFVMLNENEIRQHINTDNFHPYKFHLFSSLDSTNRYLKDIAVSSNIDICCSEEQTQGRGRFNRHWHSPFGENIYFSSRWQFNHDLSRLSGLSLVVSLAILHTLKQLKLSQNISIKWPNDILWQNKKICGSLVDIMAESNGNTMLIIGIGLNVNSHTENQFIEHRPWCSLFEISGQYFNRNRIIGYLINQLNTYLKKFFRDGFETFKEQWQQHDYLAGKHISVTQPIGALHGLAKGVTTSGELVLEDKGKKIHYLSSGDTSLHSDLSESN